MSRSHNNVRRGSDGYQIIVDTWKAKIEDHRNALVNFRHLDNTNTYYGDNGTRNGSRTVLGDNIKLWLRTILGDEDRDSQRKGKWWIYDSMRRWFDSKDDLRWRTKWIQRGNGVSLNRISKDETIYSLVLIQFKEQIASSAFWRTRISRLRHAIRTWWSKIAMQWTQHAQILKTPWIWGIRKIHTGRKGGGRDNLYL